MGFFDYFYFLETRGEEIVLLSKKVYILFFAFLIFAIYGAVIILVVIDNLQWFDAPVINIIQSFENDILTNIMIVLSFIGSLEMVIFITLISLVVFYFLFGFKKELFFIVAVSIGSTLLNVLLKRIFQRERPDMNRLIEVTGYSFPSGHSMAAFTLYVTLAFIIWSHIESKFGRSLIIVAVSIIILGIGISRIYLGVHFPSDVLGGYLTSGLWLLFSILMARKTSMFT